MLERYDYSKPRPCVGLCFIKKLQGKGPIQYLKKEDRTPCVGMCHRNKLKGFFWEMFLALPGLIRKSFMFWFQESERLRELRGEESRVWECAIEKDWGRKEQGGREFEMYLLLIWEFVKFSINHKEIQNIKEDCCQGSCNIKYCHIYILGIVTCDLRRNWLNMMEFMEWGVTGWPWTMEFDNLEEAWQHGSHYFEAK